MEHFYFEYKIFVYIKMGKKKYSPVSKKPVPKSKRSGPYVWGYTNPLRIKKTRIHKRRGLSNIPQSAMSLIAQALHRNVGKLYMTSPRSVRSVLTPSMNVQRKIASLRGKLNFRGPLNTRYVTPAYIQIVRKLQQINTTPNSNYNRRGETSTGWHARRIQGMENFLGRLEFQSPGMYWNSRNNREYLYTRKGNLIALPNNPRGRTMTIARQLSVRPNGTLYFNLRKRRERQRTRRA